MRNALADSTLWLHWLNTKPEDGRDSVPIAPGAAHTFRFPAGAPGTYMYRARVGQLNYDLREREQLLGALVIDEAGARTDDRIFVLNIWGEFEDSTTITPICFVRSLAMLPPAALTAWTAAA